MAALNAARLGELAVRASLEPAAVVVVPLEGGRQAACGGDAQLYPASMIKTPLVAAALVEVANGRFHLTDRVEVSHANVTFNDAPSPLEPGYWATLEELCTLAISRSDNVATNMLFDLIGRVRATEIARTALGLTGTAFHRKLSGSDPLIADPGWNGVHANTHPPHDAARLFASIATGDVAHADLLLRALQDQYWNDKLSKGLSEGDRFAHKTGDTSRVTHDGGILKTAEGSTYVVVAYTGLESCDTNNARFGPFMRLLRALI